MRRGTPAAILFGEYLCGLRVSRGMSLRAVAEQVGVYASTISQWEKGVRAVKENRLSALAKALGVKEQGFRTYWLDVQRQNPDEPLRHKRAKTIKTFELEELIQKLSGLERERVRGYVEAILEGV